MEEICLEKVNEQFNKELQRQIDGKLPKGHVYKLGCPSRILLTTGIPFLSIEVTAKTLAEKSDPKYKNSHPFELSEVKNLPKAINNPIMVFNSKTRKDSKVILTELKSKGVNFIVAIEMNHKKGANKNIIEINSIRSLYPKDQVKDILVWSKEGLLKYVNKEKASSFMSQLRSQFPQKWSVNVEASFTNIINNFQNGKVLVKKT
jgi:hypothetical protein